MFKAMLRMQWKGSWHWVLTFAVAAVALPVVSVHSGWRGNSANLPLFLTELQLWGFFYPALALLTAVALAISLWYSDRRGHHIYALLLPVSRSRYVWLRYLAGLAMLAPIVAALWLGSLIATATIDLPPGLRAFPHALTLKFALVLLLMFGFAFGAASAPRRAISFGFKLLGVFIAVHLAVLMLKPGTNLLWTAVTTLATAPGPFAPLGGRWMLIDV